MQHRSRETFHAGEWWQLPVTRMPSLPKANFSCRGIVATPRYHNATRTKVIPNGNFHWSLCAAAVPKWSGNEIWRLHIPKEESETFGRALMSMHGPCARVTLHGFALVDFSHWSWTVHAKRIEYCRPCGSSKKVRAAPFGLAQPLLKLAFLLWLKYHSCWVWVRAPWYRQSLATEKRGTEHSFGRTCFFSTELLNGMILHLRQMARFSHRATLDSHGAKTLKTRPISITQLWEVTCKSVRWIESLFGEKYGASGDGGSDIFWVHNSRASWPRRFSASMTLKLDSYISGWWFGIIIPTD